MGFIQRIIVGLVLVALAIGGASAAAWMVVSAVRDTLTAAKAVPPAREIVRAVNVIEYAAGTSTPVLLTYGTVTSTRTLEVRATASGTAVTLAPGFEDGGRVTEGQVLLQIDPAPFEADLRVAEADLAEAEADLLDAVQSLDLAREDLAAAEEQADLRRQAYSRQQSLLERGVGSSAAVEDAALTASAARQAVVSRRLALAAADVRIDQARAVRTRAQIAMSEARRHLDDTTIRARFSGTLSGVSLVEGRLVSANELLAELVDPDALEVSFRVSTAQHARLIDQEGHLIGLPVQALLDVSGVQLTANGVISRESAVVSQGQTGRLVYARLDAAAGFRPGDFVTVRVQEPPIDGVADLPSAAIGADGTVLAFGADDRLEAVPVTVERRQGTRVLVSGEALDGRRIVAERTPMLGAGLKVRALEPQAAVSEAQVAEAPDMLTLDPERRARLVAYVEGNSRIPGEVKSRILGQLAQEKVPAQVVERLESRMGS